LQDRDSVAGAMPGEPKGTDASRALSEKIGITASAITDALRTQFEIDSTATGVVVTSVAPGGLASAAGFEPGVVIIRVQLKEIKTVKDFESAMTGVDLKNGVRFQIEYKGMRRFIFVKE
jgi:serine protease Do